jgi:hypothetical protein
MFPVLCNFTRNSLKILPQQLLTYFRTSIQFFNFSLSKVGYYFLLYSYHSFPLRTIIPTNITVFKNKPSLRKAARTRF